MNIDKVFLKHIIDSIDDIENSTKNLTKKEFKANKDIIDATIRRIEIIGEAVKNISDKLKKKYPDIEWKKIAGTRDILIHAYFSVDLELIWDIIQKDLKKLRRNVQDIITKEF